MSEHKFELPLEDFAIAVSNENKRLHEELDKITKRLESDPRHSYDGIYCRDETIKLQEKRIERLLAEIEWHEEENQRLRNVMWATENMIRSALRDKE